MDEIRASDVEREAAVSKLRDHAAAGRLEVEELEERIQAALSAVTRAELDRLFADLPTRAPHRAPRRRRRAVSPGRFAFAGVAGAGIVGAAVAGEPWVLWFLFAWPWVFKSRRGHFRQISAR